MSRRTAGNKKHKRQRMIVKPYPKDNEWRRMGLRPGRLDQLRERRRGARAPG